MRGDVILNYDNTGATLSAPVLHIDGDSRSVPPSFGKTDRLCFNWASNNEKGRAMDTVQQLLDSKGYDIWSISPSASVFEAIEMMADKECGALLVMEGRKLDGIISERDYARKVILAGGSSKNMKVSEIMTASVITVQPSHRVEQCLSVMTEKRIRHLPVVEDDKVVGMMSIGDLVKAIIAKQAFLIAQLEEYIKQ
jgi:signal-transduction protein with cAMP-binding, CBS, and nucleotidyltransferase domain